jgi:predicted Rossmann fold flavoprotein
MSSNRVYDVIVIGGGPAGMMAAGHAALRGKRVLLVEKNRMLGKKLSITGGGRCNILNAESDTRTLLSHYGEAAKFLHSPFAQHGMQESWDFFHARGLPLTVEARKRAFPESQSAEDVTEAMRRFCTETNVELKLKTRVDGLLFEDGALVGIHTNQGDFKGHTFVLASGGSSRQETGSTGEGVSWLAACGHTVHDANPNIVPLTVKDDWVKALSGTALSFMKITFYHPVDNVRITKTGKLLFTHFGLSGPLILNAAHEVKGFLDIGHVTAAIDLYPDTDLGTVRQRILGTFEQHKNKDVKNVIKELVPAGMSEAVMSLLPLEMIEKKVHSVTKEERHLLADLLKGMPLTVTGTMGMDWAVISDGGVPLEEVDTKTMRSKKVENLYLVGDTLHVNRPSGGYSLQLCWTTGFVAGNSL